MLKIFGFAVPVVLALAALPAAHADSFSVSYLGAGVQASSASSNVETFDNASVANNTLTTTFNNSGLTGTYTGNFSLLNANVYGGANGTGKYIGTASTYTLTLSSQVNYFGMWFSALDQGNQLSFYNGATQVFAFSPANYQALVGACPTTAASPNYCGNPNSNQAGDKNEQFAFLNFYDSTGSFNKVVFTENPVVGVFESDNHTVANVTSTPGGTPLAPTPEPGTLTLMGTGLAGVAGAMRRRFTRKA